MSMSFKVKDLIRYLNLLAFFKKHFPKDNLKSQKSFLSRTKIILLISP